jgi:predicted RNase H-like HicB family nuclease
VIAHSVPCSARVVGYSQAMTLKAIIHEASEGGFWAEVPALPGCFTQAETLPELEANLREAIEGWLLAAEPDDGTTADRILEVAV